MPDAQITYFACPPRCNAGGTEFEGGHVFNDDRDFIHCDECGAEYTLPAGWFHDSRQLRKVPCERCEFIGALTSNGGSAFCKCGASAMDFCLMMFP